MSFKSVDHSSPATINANLKDINIDRSIDTTGIESKIDKLITVIENFNPSIVIDMQGTLPEKLPENNLEKYPLGNPVAQALQELTEVVAHISVSNPAPIVDVHVPAMEPKIKFNLWPVTIMLGLIATMMFIELLRGL